jgi:hypothetical protein
MNARIEQKLTDAVSKRLQCKAQFSHWTQPDKYGAVTPVFIVPQDKRADAIANGLQVVVSL